MVKQLHPADKIVNILKQDLEKLTRAELLRELYKKIAEDKRDTAKLRIMELYGDLSNGYEFAYDHAYEREQQLNKWLENRPDVTYPTWFTTTHMEVADYFLDYIIEQEKGAQSKIVNTPTLNIKDWLRGIWVSVNVLATNFKMLDIDSKDSSNDYTVAEQIVVRAERGEMRLFLHKLEGIADEIFRALNDMGAVEDLKENERLAKAEEALRNQP